MTVSECFTVGSAGDTMLVLNVINYVYVVGMSNLRFGFLLQNYQLCLN
jgi:hypothetical protein